MGQTRQRYQNDPIVEVIVGLHFASMVDVDAVALAASAYLDGSTVPLASQHFQIQLDANGPRSETLPSVIGHKRVSADGQWHLQVLGQRFSLHVLKPYPRWHKIHEQAEGLLTSCLAVAGAEFAALSLRYVDHISVPVGEALSDYFVTLPAWPVGMPGTPVAFTSSVQADSDEHGYASVLAVASAAGLHDGEQGIRLDVQLVRQVGIRDLAVSNWVAHLDELHDHQLTVFEHSITDKLRELMRGIA